MLNDCNFIGRLGKSPEVHHGDTFQATSFSIACSEKWKDKGGEQQERTEWVNCKAFGKLAEICGTWLDKGSLVYVKGKLQTSSWEKDGEKKYKTEVVLSEMKMLSPKSENKQSSGPEPSFDSGEEIPF